VSSASAIDDGAGLDRATTFPLAGFFLSAEESEREPRRLLVADGDADAEPLLPPCCSCISVTNRAVMVPCINRDVDPGVRGVSDSTGKVVCSGIEAGRDRLPAAVPGDRSTEVDDDGSSAGADEV